MVTAGQPVVRSTWHRALIAAIALQWLTSGAMARAQTLPKEPPPNHPPPPLIDAIVVHKAARVMDLFAGGTLIRSLAHIQLGRDPVGAKRQQGDGRTPEGHYVIDGANPDSAYHLALHISYPSPEDIARARVQGYDAGGGIFVHGQPDDWRGRAASGETRVPGDWTDGCIALANDQIEALWDSVPDGTPIDIEP